MYIYCIYVPLYSYRKRNFVWNDIPLHIHQAIWWTNMIIIFFVILKLSFDLLWYIILIQIKVMAAARTISQIAPQDYLLLSLPPSSLPTRLLWSPPRPSPPSDRALCPHLCPPQPLLQASLLQVHANKAHTVQSPDRFSIYYTCLFLTLAFSW